MRLDWMILGNYVEKREGLVTIVGAGWDKVFPPPGETLPEGVVAYFNGGVAARIVASREDFTQPHEFRLTIGPLGEDALHEVIGGFSSSSNEDEAQLEFGLPVILPINIRGAPLPKEGWYAVTLEIDGETVATTHFRAIAERDDGKGSSAPRP